MRTLQHAAITVGTLLALAGVASRPALAQSAWHVERTIEIGGVGGMDYLTVAPQTHRLYVPRTTHTMVIDSTSGKTLGDIPARQGPRGSSRPST